VDDRQKIELTVTAEASGVSSSGVLLCELEVEPGLRPWLPLYKKTSGTSLVIALSMPLRVTPRIGLANLSQRCVGLEREVVSEG